jgi:hypothetical protein
MDNPGEAGVSGGDQDKSAGKAVTTSQADESGVRAPTRFLFIHTSSESAPYKHGNRPSVRSHNTARARREFNQTHKVARGGGRKAVLPKSLPLGPQLQNPNYLPSMTVARSPRSSFTFTMPDDDLLASGTREFHTGPQCLPVVSTMVNINPSPFALASDSSMADYRNASQQRRGSGPYCKACGKSLRDEEHLIQAFQRIDWAKRYSGKKARTPSPVEILGAGRVDPFASYPMKANERVNELLDHCKLSCPQISPAHNSYSPT